MARTRKTFGPLFYGTLVVAAVVLLFFGIWRVIERLESGTVAAELSPDDAVTAALPRLADADQEARARGALKLGEVLCRYGPDDDKAGQRRKGLTALRGALRDKEASVRAAAAEALGMLGETARPAAGELDAAMNDEDGDVRFAAAKALLQVDPARSDRALGVLAALVAEATATNFSAILSVMLAAGERGKAAAEKAVVGMLSHQDEDVRLVAVNGLSHLGILTPELLPAIEPLLASDTPGVRSTAALVVVVQRSESIWEPDPKIIAALEAMVIDASASPGLRERALGGLYSVSPKFGAAALRRCGRGLARQLDRKELNVRLGAATLLHLIDPETLAGKNDPAEGP